MPGRAEHHIARAEMPERGIMKPEFRAGIQEVGEKALKVVESYLDGKEPDQKKADVAMRMVGHGLKAGHLEDMREQNQTSNAIRIAHLLREPDLKLAYIQKSDPKIKGMIEDRKRQKIKE